MSVLRTIVSSSRALVTGAKDVNRFREIASAFVTHGFGWVIAQLKLRRELQVEYSGTELTQAALGSRETGRRLVTVFTGLGPTWVKFGQILSTRPDILPEPIITELATLQDAVEAIPFADIESALRRNLGDDFRAAFASIDEEPLASASIAQVHRAELADGTAVVLKVQRPGIEPRIRSDLHILRAFAGYLEEAFEEAQVMALQAMVDDFSKSIAQELDYQTEAANMDRFRHNLADQPKVYIPTVYPEQSTRQVLCMEFIDGKKFSDVIAEGGDLRSLTHVYFDAAYKMLFVDGFFHGDLHPGNVFVLDDERLALIDCGMVGRLAPSRKDKIIDIIWAMLNEDLEAVASTFYSLAVHHGHVDYRAFEADAIAIAERYLVGVPLSQIRMGDVFTELVQGASRHNVHLPSDFTMMFKAILTTEGLARTIAPDVDPLALARPFVTQMISERYSPDRLKQLALSDFQIVSSLARSLPRSLPALYDTVSQGKLAFGVSSETLENQHSAAMSRQHRGIRAGFSIAAMICGTLALHVDHLPIVQTVGLPWLSVIFYVIAGVTALAVLR
ncbi:MAG: AarF/ABC1/UbiB kinase family protein [Myxococcales bacterium FL481]|nr:MAG: AarF/ABC1/UbiB kinase family protein [Myxococcales bacterium FL481]